MERTATRCMCGSMNEFRGLPFRVWVDIDDDLAANRRQPPPTAANRRQPPPTAADRSKACTVARRESATAAAQISGTLLEIAIASTCGVRRKEDVVGSFSLRAAQVAARVIGRNQPMLNRKFPVFPSRFHEHRGDASVTSIPTIDIAGHVGAPERRQVGAAARIRVSGVRML
jgi:hypothetical protein